MKIGIIIHSKTGTTLKFGNVIASRLKAKKHSVEIIHLKTNPEVNSGTANHSAPFKITNLPDCKKYDFLLIGGPVWAFNASPVLATCVRTLKNLKGKTVMPIITMGFPCRFMGGNQAAKLIQKEASAKGAKVLPGKVVPKMFHNPNKLMEKAANEIVASIPKTI